MQGTYGNGQLVTVIGGSGFVGRHVVQALAKRGYRIRVGVRRPDLAGFLRPLGMVGQIQPVQANVRYPDSVAAVMQGAVAAVNLAGIMSERGKQTFQSVHVEGADNVADAAKAANVQRLVHMSAIGADRESESMTARSRAAGEERVQSAFPTATILRASVQFGIGDSFFNRFAGIARLSPLLPLFGAATKYQPVFVGDVATAVQKAVDGLISRDGIFELGGPEVVTFRECMEIMLEAIIRKRLLAPVPPAIARLIGSVLGILPGRILTLDQARQLYIDNVVSERSAEDQRTFEGIGIAPTAMEAILPTYLSRFRVHGQFTSQSSV
jgi:NADH dehydrogenase